MTESTHTDATLYYLSGDEPKPEVNGKFLRHYTHNLCMFSERARLAFAVKQIPFQQVHVDMQNKAKWHVDANSGTLPVLEMPDGTIIIESRIIQDFAHDYAKDQGEDLYDKDPVKAAKQRLAMEAFNGFIMPFFGVMMSRGENEDAFKALVPIVEKYENWLKEHLGTGNFLLGYDHATMVDVQVFPALERLVLFENSPFHDIFERLNVKETAPTIYRYVHTFREIDQFKPFTIQLSAWTKFL